MNPNLRNQVHYGTLQVHSNAASAGMGANFQYGNAQQATFFPSNMSGAKVFSQQTNMMMGNQGIVAMNVDGFDGSHSQQRIVGMQGTMAAQMQGAISMTTNISPQFNSPGAGPNFNMANSTMMPGNMLQAQGTCNLMQTQSNMMQAAQGNMMQVPGNMMQAPGNVMQASGSVMQAQNNMMQMPSSIMQAQGNVMQTQGNVMQFYKGMGTGMINSPNNMQGINFNAQNSNVLPSFGQLFGNPNPQFQSPNQQLHQGGMITPGGGNFDNFVQGVVVNGPPQNMQQVPQQPNNMMGAMNSFVNAGYQHSPRQPVNANMVNAGQFMQYKPGENVYMMATPASNINCKFGTTSIPGGVLPRQDCRFSGPVGTTGINLPGCQTLNVIDQSHLRSASQNPAMITTTTYSHTGLTCSTVNSGQHSQCALQQRPVQSNCGHNHNHPLSSLASQTNMLPPLGNVGAYNNLRTAVSQCRANLPLGSSPIMSTGVSLPVCTTSATLTVPTSLCSSSMGLTVVTSPTTTATATITSTTVSLPTASGTSTSVTMVTVPFGWKRILEDGAVVYYSPSNTRLISSQCVQQYLQADGTCKCGLECPLMVDKVFNFDARVQAKAWTVADVSCNNDLTKFCNHKRKIIALATLQNSRSMHVPLSPSDTKGLPPELSSGPPALPTPRPKKKKVPTATLR